MLHWKVRYVKKYIFSSYFKEKFSQKFSLMKVKIIDKVVTKVQLHLLVRIILWNVMLYSVLYSLVNLVLPLTSHLSFRQKKAVVLGVITMSVRIVRQHGKEMFSVGLLPQLSLQGGIDLYFAEIFSPSLPDKWGDEARIENLLAGDKCWLCLLLATLEMQKMSWEREGNTQLSVCQFSCCGASSSSRWCRQPSSSSSWSSPTLLASLRRRRRSSPPCQCGEWQRARSRELLTSSQSISWSRSERGTPVVREQK